MKRATRQTAKLQTAKLRTAVATVLLAAFVSGCAQKTTVELSDATEITRSTSVGTAPMFAVAPSGAEAAAWVSAPEGGTDGRVYIAVDGGQPVELRDSLGSIEAHGEAPPKIVYAPDGSLNALYVVGKEDSTRRFPLAALRFARSADGGRTWSAPVTVTDDSTTFGSHNFQALHAAGDGSLYAAWLDGRGGKSSTYVSRSLDGGKTWSPNVRVTAGEACPCCRTALASSLDGTIYLAWRQVLTGNIRDIVVATSTDHGATWTEPRRVHADNWQFDGCPHAGPAMQVDASGRLHIAWWTGRKDSAGVYYASSGDKAVTFSAPVALGVAQFSRPAHVQLALGSTPGTILTAWEDGTKKVPQVVMRVSRDGGATFGDAIPLSMEGRAAGFPVLASSAKGITVAWSEQDAGALAKAEASRPNMKDPHARMGLEPVGDAQVMVRRGALK